LWRPINQVLGAPENGETFAAVALALGVEAAGSNRFVSYSRHHARYSKPRRYRDPLYTYAKVTGAVDRFDAMGLIEHRRAEPGTRGWQSSMRATADLNEVVRPMLEGVRPRPLRETIVLRNGEGLPVDYRDTRATDQMRREVAAQNEAILGSELASGNIHRLRAPIRRIFNEGFDRGGRFYAEGGGWQTLPKSERGRITIDGEPVVEVDYSEFHPTLAYAEFGHPPPAGAYDIPGFPRQLCKIAFNVMLNSRSRNRARHTIAHKPQMVELITGLDFSEVGLVTDLWRNAAKADPGYLQEASRRANRLINAILHRHQPIASMFFTGVGLRLQRRDSDIAEGVMLNMRRRGIVFLPVHDSFIVSASKAQVLEEVMVSEAARHGAVVKCKCS
jgi:hypothetical protein